MTAVVPIRYAYVVLIRYALDPLKPDSSWAVVLAEIPNCRHAGEAVDRAKHELTGRTIAAITEIRTIPLNEMAAYTI
jgi:hypothetical protein